MTIKLASIEAIETKPNKQKKNKKTFDSFGIIYERRNPKVKTNEHKLFGTKPNHKYF